MVAPSVRFTPSREGVIHRHNLTQRYDSGTWPEGPKFDERRAATEQQPCAEQLTPHRGQNGRSPPPGRMVSPEEAAGFGPSLDLDPNRVAPTERDIGKAGTFFLGVL